MIFEKYDSYKDCKLDCIKKIPKDWNSYRIDWISKLVRGNSSFKKDELLENGKYVGLQYGKTYQVNVINEAFKFYVNDEFYKSNQVVNNGDTILISTSETLEDLGHTCFYYRNDLGLIGGEQILIKPNTKYVVNKYLFYYSKVFSNKLRKYATGLKVYRVNINNLKQLFISLPQIEIQVKITNYLDIKIKKIDDEIVLLEQKIKKYSELKQVLIKETVLRGLDKKIKLKPSNIKWIGNIPECWASKRFKDIFKKKKKKYNPLFDCASISFGKVINKKVEIPMETRLSYQEVLVGEFIINPLNLNFDLKSLRTALSNNDVIMSSGYIVLQSFNNYHKSYLKWLLHQFDISHMKTLGGGVRQTINFDDIAKSHVYIPPLEEQIQIANYLDEKTSKIDAIVQTIEEKIKVLKEFRKTLINDVVTGKVKVE